MSNKNLNGAIIQDKPTDKTGQDPGSSSASGNLGNGGKGTTYTVKQAAPDLNTDDLQAQIDLQNQYYKDSAKELQTFTNASLNNIENQRKANSQQLLMKHNQINRKSDWQPNQQKEQSTYAALRRTMGNAAYGSGLADLNEGMARFDDMADVDLINTWKENQDNAYNNWYQANSDLIADYNDKVNESNQKFADLYNQYERNIGSINAQLALRAKKEEETIKKNQVLAQKNKAAANTANAYNKYISQKTTTNKAKKAYNDALQKYNKTKNSKDKKALNIAKKVLDKANKSLAKAKNTYLTANKKSALSLTVKENGKKIPINVSTKKGVKAYAKKSSSSILKALQKKTKNEALQKILKAAGLTKSKSKTVQKNQAKSLFKAVSKYTAKKATKTQNKLAKQVIKYVRNTAANKATKAQEKYISKSTVSFKPEGADKALTWNPLTEVKNKKNTLLKNQASVNNPNIPNSPTGATDYIRGTNESAKSLSKANMATPNTAGAANQQYWSKPKNEQWYRAAH